MPDTSARLLNLLGVVVLAGNDQLHRPLQVAVGRGGSSAPALVHLLGHPGTSVDGLARVLGLSQPATVRAVDRLVADGLVRRTAGRDGRTLALVLTGDGERRARAVLVERERALASLLAPLDDVERAQLEALLARIVSTLADNRTGTERTCRLCDRGACTIGAACPLEHTA